MKYFILLITVFSMPQLAFGDTSFINEIPDFTQTTVRGSNTGNGQQYCAPVAVSNSLIWLSRGKSDQSDLILKLASKNYMNTSLKDGTGTSGVLNGVNKIAVELFGEHGKLEYQGWRKHPKKYSKGIKVPTMQWLSQGITNNSAVWLNVGWYKHNKVSNEYRRIGGHWVTLVGFEKNMLIIHDPAPRAGTSFANEYVQVSQLNDGILVGKKSGLPTTAKGKIILGKGMHVKSNADLAILDGAVLFERRGSAITQ